MIRWEIGKMDFVLHHTCIYQQRCYYIILLRIKHPIRITYILGGRWQRTLNRRNGLSRILPCYQVRNRSNPIIACLWKKKQNCSIAIDKYKVRNVYSHTMMHLLFKHHIFYTQLVPIQPVLCIMCFDYKNMWIPLVHTL